MSRQTWQVAGLLFFSGMCALIYQTAWMREFRLIFGASTFATGAVLAIFMGGLGLGSALLGKRADAKTRPLAYYGNLELLIAISAALSPLLLWVAAKIYFALGGQIGLGIGLATIVRLLLASFVLAVPTLLMGGTLPAAARAVETNDDLGRRGVAVLYGVNTFGAVAGTLLSTFFMLETFGTRKTLYIAVLVNILVAIVARAMSRAMGDVATDRVEETVVAEEAVESEVPRRAVYAASAAVGFAFLLMELVWYRMLSPLLGGTTFMFGLILALALAGIALGGLAYSFWSGRRVATAGAFALTCSLEAAAIAIPFALGDRIAVVTALLRDLGTLGFYGHVLGWVLITGFIVVPAAFISGIQFPLLIALLGRGRTNVGHEIGTAYAWNTLGAIAGSLAGGFGLLPLLSAPGCWRLVTILLAAVGLFAVIYALRERQHLYAGAATIAAILALSGTFAMGPTSTWRHSGIGIGRAPKEGNINRYRDWIRYTRRALLWDADGRESSVAVVLPDDLAFIVNGKSDGSARSDAGTQVMSGIIGAMVHPNPKRAMVVGLGTGSTAGWLGKVPSLEVDVVELEPVVLEVAELCAPVNQDVMNNPRVHVEIGDAREALLASKQTYDLIFSEPSNPYRAGIASLFTKDFYESVQGRLNRGGIFLQWIQTYAIDAQTLRTVYATMHTVFPHVTTWWTAPGDLILAGTREPFVFDVDMIRRRTREEPFRSAMHRSWRMETAEGFFAHLVAAEGVADAIAETTTSYNTDDRTLIEFGFARSLGTDMLRVDEIFRSAKRIDAVHPRHVRGAIDWNLVEANRDSIWQIESRTQRHAFAVDFDQGRWTTAMETWRARPFPPLNTQELASLAFGLADSGSPAAEAYAAQLRPWNAIEADSILARLRIRQGRFDEAAELTRRAFLAYRKNPWPRIDMMARSLENLKMLSLRDRAMAARMYELLTEPFAVGQLEDQRKLTLPMVAHSAEPCGDRVIDALQAIEPNPEWSRLFLSLRASCYAKRGLPEAREATADFRRFLAAEPGHLVTSRPQAPRGSS